MCDLYGWYVDLKLKEIFKYMLIVAPNYNGLHRNWNTHF